MDSIGRGIQRIVGASIDFVKDFNKDISTASTAAINRVMADPSESSQKSSNTSNDNLSQYVVPAIKAWVKPLVFRVAAFFGNSCAAMGKELNTFAKSRSSQTETFHAPSQVSQATIEDPQELEEHSAFIDSLKEKQDNQALENKIDSYISKFGNNDKLIAKLYTALKQLPPGEYPEANRIMSLKLGQLMLQPQQNIETDIQAMNSFLNKGTKNPGACGKDFFRSVDKFQFSSENLSSSIDGRGMDPTDFATRTEYMEDAINMLYEHVSANPSKVLDHDNVTLSSQDEAEKLFGGGLKDEIDGLSEDQQKMMSRLLGLIGNQAVYTQPFNWAKAPASFGTTTSVSELLKDNLEMIDPLERDRNVSIVLMQDGSVKVLLSQPVTFKMTNTQNESKMEPVGTCRLETELMFNDQMECIGYTQNLAAAQILDRSSL